MKFDLKTPCNNCPFSTDSRVGWLGEDRAEELIQAIAEQDQPFTCHKTDRTEGIEPQHCAGALILLEKEEKPNQMMRISERLGLYDMTALDMDADVFDTLEEFIDHHA